MEAGGPARRRPRPTTGAGPDLDSALDLRAALDRLPARQRATVVLRYFGDLPVADTARALGCSEGTVKSQTAKAVDTLRELLREPIREGRA